jgi:hypothetical protein
VVNLSHKLVWPRKKSSIFAFFAYLSNKTKLRNLLRKLFPRVPQLESDITSVLYLNWKVPVKNIRSLLPEDFQVDETDSWTWVSILTFNHGNFGPKFLGPLRKLCPSPLQSNWRLYLKDGDDSVYFFKSVLDNSLYVLGSRFFSDGLPCHFPENFVYSVEENHILLNIDGGTGSSPSLDIRVEKTFEAYDEWDRWLPYLVNQNSAIAALNNRKIKAKIKLDVDLSSAQTVKTLRFESKYLEPLIKEGVPYHFYIPKVKFLYGGEEWQT